MSYQSYPEVFLTDDDWNKLDALQEDLSNIRIRVQYYNYFDYEVRDSYAEVGDFRYLADSISRLVQHLESIRDSIKSEIDRIAGLVTLLQGGSVVSDPDDAETLALDINDKQSVLDQANQLARDRNYNIIKIEYQETVSDQSKAENIADPENAPRSRSCWAALTGRGRRPREDVIALAEAGSVNARPAEGATASSSLLVPKGPNG